MSGYTSDSLVAVREFVHKRDGDEVTIGDVERQVFVAIPAEGLDILQSLAAGRTVGETVRLYEEKYQETPDIEDFLEALAGEGLVSPAGQQLPTQQHQHRHGWLPRWSFNWISQRAARRLTSWPALTLVGLIIAAGLTMVVLDPGLVPSSTVLLFPDGNLAAMTSATWGILLVGLFIHEAAHAVVARSTGAKASLGAGNLMYVLVAQTNMDGLWMVSKGKRYVAFLAGMIIDATIAAFMVAFLFAARQGVIEPSRTAYVLMSAALLTYLLRLLFQFGLYLRTDIYYVIATAMNCKNLMEDTEVFLLNLVARMTFRRHRVIDQSGIPRKEMSKIKFYSFVYVFGRLFAAASLIFLILPVLAGYLEQVVLLVTGQETRFTSIDFATLAILGLATHGTGTVLWVRNLIRAALRRRAAFKAAST